MRSDTVKTIIYSALMILSISYFLLAVFVFQKPDGALGCVLCIMSIMLFLFSLIKLRRYAGFILDILEEVAEAVFDIF